MNPPTQPATGDGDDDIDVVPGDPPVPITVWRTPAGPNPTPIPTRLAYRLLAAYTDPGDTIIDLTLSPTIADVAATGSRSLVHAHFTPANALVVTDTAATRPALRNLGGAPAAPGDLPELADWFGDDLRHTDRPAGTIPDHPTDTQPPAVSHRSLLVAPWPLHATDPIADARLRTVAGSATRILQPAGSVVFIATSDTPGRGNYSNLVHAATAAGLRYLQHIVAIGADITADQLTYLSTAQDLEDQDPARHHRVHTDLLVFVTAASAADSGKPMDSQSEPTGTSRRSRFRGAEGSL
jgi:hypothetical protein